MSKYEGKLRQKKMSKSSKNFPVLFFYIFGHIRGPKDVDKNIRRVFKNYQYLKKSKFFKNLLKNK